MRVLDISNMLVSSLRQLNEVLEGSELLAPLAREVPRYTGDETDLTTFPVSLAFVGQYSAGKTSLINALTGTNLPVGAGVVTEFVMEIPWKGLRLIDTPGVETGTREEHDVRSQAACREADLIVFVTTTALLDGAGMRLLEELAGNQRKARQMVFVANKASQDTASPTSLRQAAQSAIAPFNIPIVFCDARDHLQGMAEKDTELREELLADANIDGLSQALTQLASRSGLLGKLATPAQHAVNLCESAITTSAAEVETSEALAADQRSKAAGFTSATSHLADGSTRIIEEMRRKVIELSEEPCSLMVGLGNDDTDDDDARLASLLREADAGIEELQQAAIDELGSLAESVQERLETDHRAVFENGKLAILHAGSARSASVALGSSRKRQSLLDELTLSFAEDAVRQLSKIEFRLPTGSSPGGDLHRLVHRVKRAIHGSDIRPWSVVRSARKIEGLTKFLNLAEPGLRKAVTAGADLALEEGLRRWSESRRSTSSAALRRSFEDAAEVLAADLKLAADEVVDALGEEGNRWSSRADIAATRGAEAMSRHQALTALHATFQELQSLAAEVVPPDS